MRDQAQEVLDELDRPLVRRFRRSEILQARGDLNQVQGTIRQSVAELAETDTRLSGIQASLDRARVALVDRNGLERERHGIRRELDRDLSARASGLADDPPDRLLNRLGRCPERDPALDLWNEAAARLDQQATAFEVSDRYRRLGHSTWKETASTISGRAASQACERLERSLGRAPTIEAPGLELGL